MIRTSPSDLSELLSKMNLRRGAVTMVHSALFTLGLMDKAAESLYLALLEILGEEGTIVVPTFTYSFRRNEVFDINRTPAAKNIGIFSEYIRSLPGAVRSLDPMFSMCAIGPRAEYLMRRDTNNSFGIGSIYEKIFREKDSQLLSIGVSYSTGLTGFLHLERLASVPYREDIVLDGMVVDINNNLFKDQIIHFARNESAYGTCTTDRQLMGEILERFGAARYVNRAGIKHFLINFSQWEEIVLNTLRSDPFFMLKKD